MISLNHDFSITPGVISAQGTALAMQGMLVSDNALLPYGRVLSFSTQSDVGAWFGQESSEYIASGIYFNGYQNATVRPAKLLFSRFVTDSSGVSGWLLSGSFKGKTITDIQTASSTITLTVNSSNVTSGEIALANVTSFDEAAKAIETAIGGKVTVSWLPVQQRFLISSTTKGENSAVSTATGDAANMLKLSDSTGAVTSVGAKKSDTSTFLDDLKNRNQDWVLFTTTFTPTVAQSLAFSAWVTNQNYRFGYVPFDNTVDPLVADNDQCLAAKITASQYQNVLPVYGDYRYAMTVLAYASSLNFDATNGRVSYKFRAFNGLSPNVTSDSDAEALGSNGYTFYGQYGANSIVYSYAADGAITGSFKWLDTFLCQVWINANLLGAFANVFTENQSFPFDEEGYTSLRASVIDVAEKAKTFGAIRTGIALDASQVQQVTSMAGKDISQSLFSEGWYLFIPTQNGTNRNERKLTGAIFFYTDGSLIQSISLASIDVM